MIDRLDHLVLTTADEAACVRFCVDGLGMVLESFGDGRKTLRFGDQKINLHVKGHEFEPKANTPVPGALDLCFIASVSLVHLHLDGGARDASATRGFRDRQAFHLGQHDRLPLRRGKQAEQALEVAQDALARARRGRRRRFVHVVERIVQGLAPAASAQEVDELVACDRADPQESMTKVR